MTQFLDDKRRGILLKHAKDSNMPQLEDLKKNLLEMSPDELRQRILEIREDKKLRKTMPKARREKAKNKETARSAVLSALQGMSEDDKARLLAELGG